MSCTHTFLIWQVRTTLMNCTYPIEESILMDFVPADTRARWKVPSDRHAAA